MKKPKKILAAMVLTAVLAAVYCNYSLETEDWTISSTRLPEAFSGLRVTLLTDLHGAGFGPENQRLLEAVAESRPDLIAICGDLADRLTDREMLSPLLRELTAIAPTYYVSGNHEWSRSDAEDLLAQIADCGVTVLRGDYVLLEREGQTMVLAGVEDPIAYADQVTPARLMERIRGEIPGDPYVLMLCHRNNTLELWSGLETDAVLSGHGHGGVIRLPLVGGLLSVERTFFPKDCEGLYTRERTTQAVSRGLGWPRLWNRPHLPTAVLCREDS